MHTHPFPPSSAVAYPSRRSTSTFAFAEIDAGAALRAHATSRLSGIMYWSRGAIWGYGDFVVCASACPLADTTTAAARNAKAKHPLVFMSNSLRQPAPRTRSRSEKDPH